MSAVTEELHRRVREIRSRSAIRRWEMRQFERAHGAWFRVARLLTYAQSAWAIDESDAEALLASGHAPDPSGLELEPPRRLFLVTGQRLSSLPSARKVALRASPELLAQERLALVPFEDRSAGPPSSAS